MRFIRVPISLVNVMRGHIVNTSNKADKANTYAATDANTDAIEFPVYEQADPFGEYANAIKAVLEDIPDTWKAYPTTIKGRCDILAMEVSEFQNAVTKEQKLHELEHVGAAVQYLWSALK